MSIAVIGLLSALLLPAIQAVRESGRQTECRSHLHQFGVALAGFEGTHRRFPSPAGPVLNTGRRQFFSAHFERLPYVEQRAIFDMVNFQGPSARFNVSPATIQAASRRMIPLFQCPSDPHDGGNNFRLGFGSCAIWTRREDPDAGRGAFATIEGLKLAEVRDGLSQTAAVSERIKSDDDPGSFSIRDFWYSGAAAVYPSFPSNEEIVALARSFTPPPAFFQSRVGHDWISGDFGATWYNHLLGPNSEVADCSLDGVADVDGMAKNLVGSSRSTAGLHLARGFHPAGVHVLLLDGSVDAVSNDVDLNAWQALGRIADSAP